MLFLALIILLVGYVITFWRAASSGFNVAMRNWLLLGVGALMVLPTALGAWWYFMIFEWPMNIGGKPNWNWYHNEPVAENDFGVWNISNSHRLMYAFVILLAILVASYAYAGVRIFRAWWNAPRSNRI